MDEHDARRLARRINDHGWDTIGAEGRGPHTAFHWQEPDGTYVVKVEDLTTGRERVVRSWRDDVGSHTCSTAHHTRTTQEDRTMERSEIRTRIEENLDPGAQIRADVRAGVPREQGVRAYAEETVLALDAAFEGDCGVTVDDMEAYVEWLIADEP